MYSSRIKGSFYGLIIATKVNPMQLYNYVHQIQKLHLVDV